MEYCDTVESEKGKEKLVARGYMLCLRLKKTRKTAGDTAYYWRCEDRKCNGSAVTVIHNNRHQIQKFTEHTLHAANASRPSIARVMSALKRRAENNNDKPAQIVQEIMSTTDPAIQPYLPKPASLKQTVKRIRKEEHREPSSLTNLNIPPEFMKTLNGESFMISNSDVGSEKVLLFTTTANVRKLSEASYWIMDGTFKTVPTIFTQLYSIHAPVGPEERSRILPLAYGLMSSKSLECYRILFQNLNDFADASNIVLKPSFVISDYELAAINAVAEEFPETTNSGCLFHLGQSIYRKVQGCGLSNKYATEEGFSIKIRQIAALAFLPPTEITSAWIDLMSDIPSEAKDIVQWFDDNYVRGRVRRILRGQQIRASPLFPPALWSVSARVEWGIPRTQNTVESWHRRLEVLVGRAHVGVFKLIKELQKEQQQVEVQIECILRGEPRKKQKMCDKHREERLMSICNARASYTTTDFLRGIAHNLHF